MIGNAGPSTALGSMGPQPTFRCHFLNIGPGYKQQTLRPVGPHHVPYFLLRSTIHKEGPKNRFSPIPANAIWDQHFRLSRPQRDGRIGGNFETRMIRILITCPGCPGKRKNVPIFLERNIGRKHGKFTVKSLKLKLKILKFVGILPSEPP